MPPEHGRRLADLLPHDSWLTLSPLTCPYSPLQRASASADMKASANVLPIARSRSGLAVGCGSGPAPTAPTSSSTRRLDGAERHEDPAQDASSRTCVTERGGLRVIPRRAQVSVGRRARCYARNIPRPTACRQPLSSRYFGIELVRSTSNLPARRARVPYPLAPLSRIPPQEERMRIQKPTTARRTEPTATAPGPMTAPPATLTTTRTDGCPPRNSPDSRGDAAGEPHTGRRPSTVARAPRLPLQGP